MKGVFLVVLMMGLLITALLVVKNISTRQTLEGDPAQIMAIDRAKDAADLINQQTESMNRKLQRAAGN
jgi:hypothetical protein